MPSSSSSVIFSSLRRRGPPSLESYLAPIHLTEIDLVQSLAAISSDLISTFASHLFEFQRRNSRALIRKIEVLAVLFEYIKDSGTILSTTVTLCFKELYLLMYRSKILLDYVSQSSKLWMILQNSSISGHFCDLNQEISTLLDVLPLKEVIFLRDVREQLELLKRQSRRAKLFVDRSDDSIRVKLFRFLDEFEVGEVPNLEELRAVFVNKLGIGDAKACRYEIEFLEEQIYSHDGDGDGDPTACVLNGVVALTRYARFLLFGFEEEEEGEGEGEEKGCENRKNVRKGLSVQEIGDTLVTIPKDFCCPISLDIMQDPVIVSTGQTYDRVSISRWMGEGHCSCPKTGQILAHTRLVPNRALHNLISQWCNAHKIPLDPVESTDITSEFVAMASSSKAAIEANKATAEVLVQQLSNGTQGAKTVAARELRLLAKTGKENRACIAEAGAIPLLRDLLSSQNPLAQENSVTAILNLSIYDKNKSRIMEEAGCLGSVVEVLRFGITTEARENAAATLFSLSAVHEYKKRISAEDGAVEALAKLLSEGSSRGKKDAVTALFNLSTHSDSCKRMIEAGAVVALLAALGSEGVAEEAAGALALLVRQPIGAEHVAKEEMAVTRLINMMRRGTPKGKENAVAALLELCRGGGALATQRVLRVPALASLLQTLLFTGTKRARRKAASLARVCQRCEAAVTPMEALGVAYGFPGNSTATFVSDVSVAPVSISVPVL